MTDDEEQEFEDGREPPTPQIRKRPMLYEMPADQRDSRRAATSNERAQAMKRNMAPPMGVPVVALQDPDPDDTTSPHDLFNPERVVHKRRRGDSAVELAARLRASSLDPYDYLAALGFEVTDRSHEDRSASKELDRQFRAFMARQPGGPEFDRLKSSVRFWKWAIGLFLVPAIAALAAAISIMLSNAAHEGALNETVGRLKSDVQLLLQEGRRNQVKDLLP